MARKAGAAAVAPKRNRGQFEKGRSGNPGGRPKELAEVKELARAHTEEAIRTLVGWMRSDNAKAAVAAANILLDRAWGKATQNIDITAPGTFVISDRPMSADEWEREFAGVGSPGGAADGTGPLPAR